MTKEKDDNTSKKRSDKYEEKVKYDGTFEDMVQMSFGGKKSTIYFPELTKGDSIDTKDIVAITPKYYEPYYIIQIKVAGMTKKIEWQYIDENDRDKEMAMLKETWRPAK